jgi:ribosomal protein S18 acetylase RimI-like enzyme
MKSSDVQVRSVHAEEMPVVRMLFTEYAEALGVSLCFQDFENEVATLPGKYAPPAGTILFGERAGRILGVVALRPLEQGVAEMKRLYVRPEARGLGLGRALALNVIEAARSIGYQGIRLDTLPQMLEARELYKSLGFLETSAYYQNPHGAIYLELQLLPRYENPVICSPRAAAD